MLTHSSRKTREMAYPSPTNWPTRLRSDQWFFMAKPRHSHAVCTLWVHLLRTLPDKTFWNWKSDDAYMHHWLVKKFSSSLQTPDVDTIVHWKLKYTMYVVVEIVDTCLWMAVLINFIIWLTGLAMVILKMKGGPCPSGWKPWVCWGELCHWQQRFLIAQTSHSVCVLIPHCQHSCCLGVLWSRAYNCCVPGRGKQRH